MPPKSKAEAPAKKIDIADNKPLTYDELLKKYKGQYNKKELKAYWEDDCKDVKGKKEKSNGKPDPKAKAKAKPEPKAKAAPKSEAKPKNVGKDKGGLGLAVMSSYEKCVLAEYVWLDAHQVTRSKTMTMTCAPGSVKDLRIWNYDGSSTEQAEGHNSEVLLYPRAIFKDPFRGGPHILVLCDVYNAWDGKPSIGNTRADCAATMEKYKQHDPWFGIEQEYTLMRPCKVGEVPKQPLGFNADGSEPAPQGPYYCSAGTGNSIGRKVADEHYVMCLKAGVKIAGTNAEVMPGQWEFQVGPCRAIEMGDHLTMSRYLMLRVTEGHECICSFSPKPRDGDWNGAGCHTNFSIKEMRAKGGYDTIIKVCDAFAKVAKEHIAEYGEGNEKRLTGAHETCSINQFKYGVADRGASIRIPRDAEKDGRGYMEDRRPGANCDPYRVTCRMMKTTGECLAQKTIYESDEAVKKFLAVKPKFVPPLDTSFVPWVLMKKKYLEAVKDSPHKLTWALPRADGCGSYSLPVFEDGSPDAMASIYVAGVCIQEMIWQRSAMSLLLNGPPKIVNGVKSMFSPGGMYEFEIKSMPNVCGKPDKPFKVSVVKSADKMPENKDSPQECGKDAKGCRLAFDLGKSDVKTVAVKDNEVLYSKETEWDVTNPDPDYHFKVVTDALNLAKEKLPQVDAIGGSATGTISAENHATWCDIFPNVPPAVYKAKVIDIFIRMADHVAGKKGVPLKVINDGEVTALAAVQKLKKGSIMGISMGSSEGGGYANADGNLLGWINELCYIRLDMNPDAPDDPWTKGNHTGLSHMYLGQRGATKLAHKCGIKVPENMQYPHPDMCTIKHEDHAKCLKLIQEDMKKDPKKTGKIYETVGIYLGYALAQYQEFYDIEHVLILGRLSKGDGGDMMLNTAKKVLKEEFPDLKQPEFHTADDHFKAVGQCIAAAALPVC
jgi:glutamine synthetase